MPAQRRVRKVRSLADCPSISSHQSTFIICPHLLLFSIYLLKNTFPYVTEQDNLSAFFHLIRGPSTPTRTSSFYLTKFGGTHGNFLNGYAYQIRELKDE